MAQKNVMSFALLPFEGYNPPVFAIVPEIDGVPLTELVDTFERERNFEPRGGYGGVVPNFFQYGTLEMYFLGQFAQDSYWASLGGIYVLGCKCGEVGCWPLQCRVQAEGDNIVWKAFRQPHRSTRDYSDFGPFIFDAAQYREAVSRLLESISP